MAIKSFRKKRGLHSVGEETSEVPLTKITFDSHRAICRRLSFLDCATCLEDLMNWKTNRFMNVGTRDEPRYHIWVDSRFALGFNWDETDAYEVEIIDRTQERFDDDD